MNEYSMVCSVKVGVGSRSSAEVGPEVPLTLREAAVLPELGGRFSPKQLRSAIEIGALSAESHGGTLYITRAGIRAWREAARVMPKPKDAPSRAVRPIRRDRVVDTTSVDAALLAVRALRPQKSTR